MSSQSANVPTDARQTLLATLPLRERASTLRVCTRDDVDILAGWPSYPEPYDLFNLSYRGAAPEERDRLFAERQSGPDRIALVLDAEEQRCAGYLTLKGIDWSDGTVDRLGIRIHPSCCDGGLGTALMGMCAQWAFQGGLKRIRLDVAASNLRAIRCYEKVGYFHAGELWRDDPLLARIDLAAPTWAHLRPHVDCTGDIPRLRFWIMDLTPETLRPDQR